MNVTARPEDQSKQLTRQEQLLPFLLNRNSYPHRPKRVELLQTHCSFVFLVSPFVFKVKKPVNFGFLNFSTLEKRRYFCEREVELNRRLCPKMYLGVVLISMKAGRFTFGEGDQVVEYAVKMRKLSDRYFLDRLVERDEAVPGPRAPAGGGTGPLSQRLGFPNRSLQSALVGIALGGVVVLVG